MHERSTDGTLIAQRMENIQGLRVSLLAAPNEVDPRRQVSADIVTFESLSIQRDKQEGVLFRPWRQLDMVYSLSVVLLDTEVQVG